MKITELDFLELNILKAITMSSVFTFNDIKSVYVKCRSFDNTVKVLKLSVQKRISLDDSFNQLFFEQQ